MKEKSSLSFGFIWLVVVAIAIVNSVQQVRADGLDMSKTERLALDAVARRIDAFNKHDTDAYLLAHDLDVMVFEYPNKKLGEGRSHLKRLFGPLLDNGIGSVDVVDQFVVDSTVVSSEIVSFGGTPKHIIAVYTVEDNLISSFRLIESER